MTFPNFSSRIKWSMSRFYCTTSLGVVTSSIEMNYLPQGCNAVMNWFFSTRPFVQVLTIELVTLQIAILGFGGQLYEEM